MKKLLFLPSLIFFFSAIHCIPVHAQKYRLVIKVLSGDRNEPVEGATIWIDAKYDPKYEGIRRKETTMEDGTAYREFDFAGTFEIKVSHAEFKDAVKYVTVKSGTPSGDVPVTLLLTRKSELKVVEINVVEKGNKFAIYDANIILDGSIGYYTAQTDASGKAVINVTKKGDSYNLTIKHTGFEPINTTLKVKGYDEQKEYKLSFEMISTKEDAERILIVTVWETSKGGNRPSMAAGVNLPDGQIKITDRNGSCEIKHKFPPGEQIKVEVEKNGYKTVTSSFIVNVRGNDKISVTLTKDNKDENTPDIAGTWTYRTEWVYIITQNGSDFTWSLAKINQKGVGKITGKSVSAKWSGPERSDGSASGTVIVDASGRAIRIDWSNGVVFTRQN